MKLNKPISYKTKTHEGGEALVENPLAELRRTLSTCLLFENTYYESGFDIADRLSKLAYQVKKEDLIAEILRAKHELKLRHAPLWMARLLTYHYKGKEVGDTIASVITRADELAEFLAMYWMEGKSPLSKQAKRGLAKAFKNFDEYQFAKYDRDGNVKLRDVMFLVHPKPEDEELFRAIAERTLATPDTWEVGLSGAKTTEEKYSVWVRLLENNKLGSLALLRNLRNMEDVSVPRDLVKASLERANFSKILPFQFVSAWRNAPAFAKQVEDAMMKGLAEYPARLKGLTILVVDVSGSMEAVLSLKSETSRMDASCALAIAIASLSDDIRIFSFSSKVKEIPNSTGFHLLYSIQGSQPHSSTYLARAVDEIIGQVQDFDRIIVITDEQAHDNLSFANKNIRSLPAKDRRFYILNVAPYQYGVNADGFWTRINGFSTSVVDWLALEESEKLFVDK